MLQGQKAMEWSLIRMTCAVGEGMLKLDKEIDLGPGVEAHTGSKGVHFIIGMIGRTCDKIVGPTEIMTEIGEKCPRDARCSGVWSW